MAEDVVNFACTALTDAVAVLADAESSLLKRNEAQRFCQELKDKPHMCVPCGLRLTDRSKAIAVRLLGFQILEHYVTHHWTQASQQEKMQLRTKAMDFMSAAVANSRLRKYEAFLEAIARVKVELIKREEPETWPAMLRELGAFMGKGYVQVELGMLVLGKVSEAVVAIEGQDPVPLFEATVNGNLHLILEIAKNLLQDRIEKYQILKQLDNQEPVAQACARAIIAVLKTMTGYLAWVPPFHVTSNKCSLLEKVWCLMNEPCYGAHASECLFVAINKLASHPNETPLLVLFDDVTRMYLFRVPLTTGRLALTDQRYAFLKTICRIMCIFGQDLCRIMSLKSWDGTVPANFDKYLNSLLAFTTHSSHYLSSLTQSTWKGLFSVERLSKDRRLLSMIPKYLSAAKTKLLKVGFPSKNDSPSCEISCIDFITDVEFHKFFKHFLGDQKQVIDVVCRLDQITCFQVASVWLKDLVQPRSHSTSEMSPVGTISFLQWEAMTFFFKVIVTNMFRNLKREAIPVKGGTQLLQILLHFKSKNPRILACVPKNINTLLPLLHFENECSTRVLTKLLEIIEEVNVNSYTCNSVRRDACMCIIRLCQSHAKILLPSFALLFNHVKQLLCDKLLQLTQMVKSTLMEAMVIIINNFKDYELQKTYLEELMLPVSSLWLSEEMQMTLADPESFVSYVGGDLLVTDTLVQSPTDLNRSGMIHCVATILGVLRWTKSTADLENIALVSNERILCNPCAEQVLKVLDNLFVLIRTQHNLYFPGVLSNMGELMSKSLKQSKIENTALLKLSQLLLDIYDPPEYTTALEIMQGFFSALYTSCFFILGCACVSLNKDFYSISNLADKIGNSAFVNLEYVPHCRILCVILVFLRPLLLNCPHEYHESLASPILILFLTSLRLRLFYGWNDIDQTNMVSKEESVFENAKLEEKMLTKEVLQLIIDCCIDKDKITITDEPSVMNGGHEPHKDVCKLGADVSASASNECNEDPGTSPGSLITEVGVSASFCEDYEIRVSAAFSENAESLISAVSRLGPDANVATAEADACCVSNEDAVTVICTTESDDDDLSIADARSSISSENVGKSKETDVACDRPSEKANSSFEANNACSVTNQGPDSVTVADKPDNVCILLEKIDAGDMSSEETDGEMAAEVPQNQHSIAKEQPLLRKLGICLMKDEDVRYVLLNTSFSTLMWKDFCHKAATWLCWPLLQHVMFEPLLLDTVIHLFTKVMKALQIHRHDLLVHNTIDCLAYRMYASLRPQYIELNRVMRQIPNINLFSLDTFDEKLLDATIQKPDPGLQKVFKDLIKSDVHEPFNEQKNSMNNVPKSTRKSLKHLISTKLPQTASKLKKRCR